MLIYLACHYPVNVRIIIEGYGQWLITLHIGILVIMMSLDLLQVDTALLCTLVVQITIVVCIIIMQLLIQVGIKSIDQPGDLLVENSDLEYKRGKISLHLPDIGFTKQLKILDRIELSIDMRMFAHEIKLSAMLTDKPIG